MHSESFQQGSESLGHSVDAPGEVRAMLSQWR